MTVRHPVIELSEAQQKIVEWVDGPVLVSAGPGSGKTRVIIERIARLLEKGVRHESILATTFTRKAADEMNSRLAAKGVNNKKMSVQTMHSLCWRIIREHKLFHGWTVDDKDAYRIVVKSVVGYKYLNWIGVDVTQVESFISAARNNLVSPEKSAGFMKARYRDPRYAQAYLLYSEAMGERRMLTFDDMLYYGVRLLEQDAHLLDRIRGQYTYVMVDEFQDSNFAQLQLTDLISRPLLNLMAVGDIDQAIYSWRGALPEFMLEFVAKYGATLIELTTNYRCAPKIVAAASECIKNNENRFSKELKAERNDEATIKFNVATSTDEEAEIVADEIRLLHADQNGYGGMRVLMRTNAQSRAFEEEFIKRKIPFVVLGGGSFYERKEIRGLLSYLRLIHDPRDIASGERAINTPFRFVGRRLLDMITQRVPSYGSYLRATESVVHDENKGGRVVEFVELMESFDETEKPDEVLKTIVRETDFIRHLMEEEGSDTPETSRAGNVSELIASATRFRTIAEFVDYIDTQIRLRKRNQREKSDARVQVMTIHKSKGTEADTVFIVGANEGIIPHAKGEEEEERRLFYVAMTRAKTKLYVSMITGEDAAVSVERTVVSRFVREAGLLPDDEEENLTAEIEPDIVVEQSSSEGTFDENTGDVPCGALESVHGRDESGPSNP